jgi:hypothetical protein
MLHVVLAAFPPVISLSCSAKAFNSLLHKRMLHSHVHAGVGLQGCKLHSGTALKELAGPVCRRSLPLHLTPVLIYPQAGSTLPPGGEALLVYAPSPLTPPPFHLHPTHLGHHAHGSTNARHDLSSSKSNKTTTRSALMPAGNPHAWHACNYW